MKRYNKLIFVDDDDNSRAPMAKIIMRSKYLLGPMEVESRGLVVLFPEPMNHVADHVAKQLVQEDIGDDVLILTMEDAQKDKIWENYESAKNVYTLTEYIRLRGELAPLYGEPLKEYGKCYEILEKLLDGLVVQLNEEELLSQ